MKRFGTCVAVECCRAATAAMWWLGCLVRVAVAVEDATRVAIVAILLLDFEEYQTFRLLRMCSENAGKKKKNKIDSKLERSSLMRFPKVSTLQLRINSIRSTKNSMISTLVPAGFRRINAIYV